MRWHVVRLIAAREIRDLLRDRRTLFLVFGLPVLLYPVFGLLGFIFAMSMLDAPVRIGVIGLDHLPGERSLEVPPQASIAGPAVIADRHIRQFPPMIQEGLFVHDRELNPDSEPEARIGGRLLAIPLSDTDHGALQRREVDAILIVPAGFSRDLEQGRKPELRVLGREGDERSKLAVRRLVRTLEDWRNEAKVTRFARLNLPADFDKPIKISDPYSEKEPLRRTVDELRDTLVKVLPFLVVVWAMAGALHPAVDMTAGEKERGTMETLLISPAERLEIVGGKFLATLSFSYFTSVWNVFWMGGGAMILSLVLNEFLPLGQLVSLGGLAWAILFALPLSALFSAVALALGLYARSTKEGQYYLIPLILFTMPLTFLSLAPGVRLDTSTCWIPVTGMTLLLQELMSVSPSPGIGWYFIPVLGTMLLGVVIALFWAVRQFHNEDVLFRESEQDMFAWFRRKVRKKESPS